MKLIAECDGYLQLNLKDNAWSQLNFETNNRYIEALKIASDVFFAGVCACTSMNNVNVHKKNNTFAGVNALTFMH